MKFFTSSHFRATTAFFLAVILCTTGFKGFSTIWNTIAAGNINTLGNWSNGSTSPSSFTTPGDTWNVTMDMTMSSGTPWTVGTMSGTPVNVNVVSGGSITGSLGGFQMTLNIYGNLNVADSIIVNGGGCTMNMNVWGNYTQSAGSVDANGGGCILVYNIRGGFTMTDGSIIASGGLAIDTIGVKGNFSMSGPSFIASNGGSATGLVILSLSAVSGTMMIDNTSTGTWQLNSVYVNPNCVAQLDGNFGTSAASALIVDGTLDCPAAYTVNGTGKFILDAGGTLRVGHATGVNGAIVTSGLRTFSNAANYGFNGTVAQVTGTDMPASLIVPDTIMINNSAGVTLTQNTTTTGTLGLVNGVLYTGTYTMSVPGAAASVYGAGAASYVNGTLVKTISGHTTMNFEVGDTTYAPMAFTLTGAGTAGSFGVKVTAGLHPNVATSGFSTSRMANHYWTVTNMGAVGPTAVLPQAQYDLSTIIGGSNMYFRTQEYVGTAWLGAPLGSVNASSPYTSAPLAGIPLATFAGDYIFGRIAATLAVPQTVDNGQLQVFPNPNKGSFMMLLHDADDHEVQVVISDVTGKTVKELTATTNKMSEVKMNGVPGMYLLSVSDRIGRKLARVVIE